MKYLTNSELSVEFILQQIDNVEFENYKQMSKDDRLWYKGALYNYDTIVQFLFNNNITQYKSIVEKIRSINQLLFESKVPLLDEYHVYKSFKKLKENNK